MNKFEPCYEHCYLRYGKQYTADCDNTCRYAEAVLARKINADIIEYLLDMLEEEHIGMRGVAIKSVKEKFCVEL